MLCEVDWEYSNKKQRSTKVVAPGPGLKNNCHPYLPSSILVIIAVFSFIIFVLTFNVASAVVAVVMMVRAIVNRKVIVSWIIFVQRVVVQYLS